MSVFGHDKHLYKHNMSDGPIIPIHVKLYSSFYRAEFHRYTIAQKYGVFIWVVFLIFIMRVVCSGGCNSCSIFLYNYYTGWCCVYLYSMQTPVEDEDGVFDTEKREGEGEEKAVGEGEEEEEEESDSDDSDVQIVIGPIENHPVPFYQGRLPSTSSE